MGVVPRPREGGVVPGTTQRTLVLVGVGTWNSVKATWGHTGALLRKAVTSSSTHAVRQQDPACATAALGDGGRRHPQSPLFRPSTLCVC